MTGQTHHCRCCQQRGFFLTPLAFRLQRRVISVLFADIQGFTAFTELQDPEEVRALQEIYFRTVASVIHRWDGVIEKYIGDAVVAVFGVPRCQEDDAYRAVRAGLEIQEAVTGIRFPDGAPLRVRVGVATGEAVVDLTTAWDGGQWFVTGDVVNTAARLQAVATPGTVVVTAATRRITDSLIDYQELPPVQLAGKRDRTPIWRAREPRRPAHIGSDDGQLVGRAREIADLTAQVTRAIRTGVPCLVTVRGVAGVGKSRLIREAARRTSALPARWWFGHCSPASGPYGPLAEMIARHAGILTGDDPATVRHRLMAMVESLFPSAERAVILGALIPLLHTTAGFTTVPDTMMWAWRRLVLEVAARHPLVLVFEDLHRTHPATVRFIQDLFLAARAYPRPVRLAILVTSRPEEQVRPLGHVLTLQPLSPALTNRLLENLLRHAGQPLDLIVRLQPLVAGLPGYAEEYVTMVTEQGFVDGAVPERVARIVAAQLDRLSPVDMAVLRAAAVLGDAVWPDAVAALLDTAEEQVPTDQVTASLHRLAQWNLLVRRPRSTIPGQVEYAFTQPVVQQVTYARLSRADRLKYHLSAAEWLDATVALGLSGLDVPANPEVDEERARHWLVAAELEQARNGDAEPYRVAGCDALAAAARGLIRRGAVKRALTLAERALALWPAAGSTTERMRLELLGVYARYLLTGDGPALRDDASGASCTPEACRPPVRAPLISATSAARDGSVVHDAPAARAERRDHLLGIP